MMKPSLIKKFLLISYGSWVGLVLGVVTTMITTRLLPPDAFGKASMFDLLLQVAMILTIFGADQSFVRFFYEEKPSKRGALLYNSLRLPMFSTFILIVILIIWYKPITIFLIDKSDFSLIIWLSVGIIAQLLFRYGQLVIRMEQKGNLYSLLQILQRVFNLIIIILLFFKIGANFEVLVLSKVITLILLVCVAIIFGRKLWSLKNLNIKNVKHSQKTIISFGAPFVLTIFISWLFESFDKLALRQWSDFNELGLYAAAMRLVALVLVLKQTFSAFWVPVAYEKFENKPDDKAFFKHISILVSFAMYLVAIASIAGKDMIVMILGEEYQAAASIMPFLVFMPIFYTISETTVIGINFYKRTKWHILIAGISCIINIMGNALLVPNYGALGASISTGFSYVIFFILRTKISNKYYKVNYPLKKIYFMLIVISIYAIISIIYSHIWLNIIFGIISVSILCIIYYKDLIYIIKHRGVILG